MKFATEAALCAAFLAWAAKTKGVTCYAEWAGWDILLVYADGYQLGIQAKLRLNAEVIDQAAPDKYGFDHDSPGPDFRAVLVPALNPLSGIAARLGLVVFYARETGYPKSHIVFEPDLAERGHWRSGTWLDWNPAKRHELPPVLTDAVAGSPCPVTLTPWKLAAMDVLAEIQVKGTITTKRMRELGVNPSRWLSNCWLEYPPDGKRGLWIRGARCPRFDEQHPTAYVLALEKATAESALPLPAPEER